MWEWIIMSLWLVNDFMDRVLCEIRVELGDSGVLLNHGRTKLKLLQLYAAATALFAES